MKCKALLIWMLLFCLLLAACSSDGPAGESSKPAETETGATMTTPTRGPADLGKTVKFELGGQCQVEYTVNMSAVHYIDSPDKLPRQEGLEKYDAAWFREHALLLVYETVRNSSMEVGIERIDLEEGCAGITLTHGPGENPGTTMMTTWLLWAEVERGLDYSWTVLNPAEESQIEDT